MKLAEREANTMPHKLMREGARDTNQRKAPYRVFKHALMPVTDQGLNVFGRCFGGLPRAKRHITNPTGKLDEPLRRCRNPCFFPKCLFGRQRIGKEILISSIELGMSEKESTGLHRQILPGLSRSRARSGIFKLADTILQRLLINLRFNMHQPITEPLNLRFVRFNPHQTLAEPLKFRFA